MTMFMRSMGGIPDAIPFITTTENKENTRVAVEEWQHGPVVPSNDPTANKPYWMALARAFQVDEREARRHRCSNCTHYDNSSMKQALMERIPQNAGDVGAGYRGYCKKFDFICHDLRSCQAQQERDFDEFHHAS